MFKRILIQLIFLKIIFTTDPNCSKIIDGVCSVCNFNFRLEEGKCIPIKPSKYSTQQKQRTLNSAEKKYEMQSQRPRYSRKLQSLKFRMKTGRRQLFWFYGKLGLNVDRNGKTDIIDHYLEGPNNQIAVHVVNDLFHLVNKYNAAYPSFPPIVLRTGQNLILDEVEAPVDNISFSQCTCNRLLNPIQESSMRQLVTQVIINNLDMNAYPQTPYIKPIQPPPLQKPYIFNRDLTISATLKKTDGSFFVRILNDLGNYNLQRKEKDSFIIIVNQSGYQLYINNTLNTKRFFFLTLEGESDFSFSQKAFIQFLLYEQILKFNQQLDIHNPDPQPTKSYYCLEQDPSKRFCKSCFAGFTFRDGQCLKQETFCQRFNPHERVCVMCKAGYYRDRMGRCIKANLSEFCLRFHNLTRQCTQCQSPYQLQDGKCRKQSGRNYLRVAQPSSINNNSYQNKLRQHQIAVIKKIAELDDLERGKNVTLRKTKPIKTSNQAQNLLPSSIGFNTTNREIAQSKNRQTPISSSRINDIFPRYALPLSASYSKPPYPNMLSNSTNRASVSTQLPKPTSNCIYCKRK